MFFHEANKFLRDFSKFGPQYEGSEGTPQPDLMNFLHQGAAPPRPTSAKRNISPASTYLALRNLYFLLR